MLLDVNLVGLAGCWKDTRRLSIAVGRDSFGFGTVEVFYQQHQTPLGFLALYYFAFRFEDIGSYDKLRSLERFLNPILYRWGKIVFIRSLR